MDTNRFGVLGKEYDVARRGYPSELFLYLHSLSGEKSPSVLDLGCGTGISTRELVEHGFRASGTDKDPEMIRIAKEKDDRISYAVAPTASLPFEDARFDLATAFTSFHWFYNNESVREIKRVLKSGGAFFVARKRMNRSEENERFRMGYRAILNTFIPGFEAQKDLSKQFLEGNGFREIQEKSFYVKEKYTVEESLLLTRSFSYWHLVPDEKREAMLEDLERFFNENLVDGLVVRDWEITTVVGYK